MQLDHVMLPKDFQVAGLPVVTDARLREIGNMFARCETESDLLDMMYLLDPLEVLSLAAECMWSRLNSYADAQEEAEEGLLDAKKKGTIH